MIAGLRSGWGLARSLAIYRGRPWQTEALARFYGRLVRPGDLAFDVGAHVGNRTLALRRAGARVVAIEPQRLFYAFLRRNMPRDVVVLPLAVGDRRGTAALAVSRLHPTVSSLKADFAATVGRSDGFEHVRWDAAEPVPVTTLDALIAEHGRPRLIKIDVEGFEADVLAGLSEPVAFVAFEYLPAALDVAEAAASRLDALGLGSFNLVQGEEHEFALPEWLPKPEFLRALRRIAADGRPGDVYARAAGAGGTQ